jgi:hypothetical protein
MTKSERQVPRRRWLRRMRESGATHEMLDDLSSGIVRSVGFFAELTRMAFTA